VDSLVCENRDFDSKLFIYRILSLGMIQTKFMAVLLAALGSMICSSVFLLADVGLLQSTLLMSLRRPRHSPPTPVSPVVKVNEEQTPTVQGAPPIQNPAVEPIPPPPVSNDSKLSTTDESAIDLANRVRREGGEYDKARLTFTLGWNDTNDLDLHVIPPDGGEICYSNKRVDGGVLDVDMNAPSDLSSAYRLLYGSSSDVSPSGNSNEPVENVSWSVDFPRGLYKVRVVYYAKYGPNKSDYKLQVRYGKITKTVSGTVLDVKDQFEYEFVIP